MGWLKSLFGGGASEPDGVSIARPHDVTAFTRTESGLEYADIKPGDGVTAAKGNRVTVHYTGWLTSGKRFDSSAARKKPFSFTIGARKVIKGWDEGVATMKVGGIRQLRVPPSLGYGPIGHPPVIPRNATLIFEIQLLSID